MRRKILYIAMHWSDYEDAQTTPIGVFEDIQQAQKLLERIAPLEYGEMVDGVYQDRQYVVHHWAHSAPESCLIRAVDAEGTVLVRAGYIMATGLNEFHNPDCGVSLIHVCDESHFVCESCQTGFCGQYGADDEYPDLCDGCWVEMQDRHESAPDSDSYRPGRDSEDDVL